MSETKPWYQSITLWGAIIAGLAAILNACGISVSDDEQRSAAELLTHIGEGVGLILVIWGRFRARHTLTGSGGSTAAGLLLAAGVTCTSTLAACSYMRAPTPTEALLTACDGWRRALTSLAAYRAAGELSRAQITAVDYWRPIMSDACYTPPATDASASTLLAMVERGMASTVGILSQAQTHDTTETGDPQ